MRAKIMLFVVCVFILGQALGISSYAVEEETLDIARLEKYIPEEALEMLPDGLLENGGVQAVEKLSFSYFFGLIFKILGALTKTTVAKLSMLLGLVIISSLFHMLAQSSKLSTFEAAFSTVTSLCVCIAAFEYVTAAFVQTRTYLQTLSSFANAVTPFVTLAYTLGGNVTSAVVSSNGLLVCMTVLENINAYVLYPMLTLSASLGLARACAPNLRVGTLASFVRGVLTLLVGLTVAAISAIMTFQTTLASSADSLGARAVRFAAASFIPIVGGAVSEAVRTVSSSVIYIRTTVGAIGIAVIVVTTLPIFVSLMLSRINFSVAASLADLLGCDRECKVMKEAGGLINFLIALVSMMAVLFVYSLTLLIRCASAYGG